MDMFYYNADKTFSTNQKYNSILKSVPYSQSEMGETYRVHAKNDEGWDRGIEVEILGEHINEYDIVKAFGETSKKEYLESMDVRDLIEGDEFSQKWSLIKSAQKGDAMAVSEQLSSINQEEHQDSIQAALGWASHEGHGQVVKAVLPHLDKDSVDGRQALGFAMERAVSNRQEAVAKQLMEHVDLKQDDSVYLRMACYTGQTEMAKTLLENSSPSDAMTRMAQDNQEMKAMLGQDEGGYEKGIEVLSSIHSVTPNSHVFTSEMEVMGEAGDTEAIKNLIGQGANPQDAIYEASLFGHLDTVEALVKAGAKPDDGLAASVVTGQEEVFKHLLPLASQEGKDRALVNAADHGQVQLTQDLLDVGADANAFKAMAFRCAINNEHQSVANVLAKHVDDFDELAQGYKDSREDYAVSMMEEAREHRENENQQRSNVYRL